MKKILSAYDIMDSMVESYSKNANHNMRRPVVKEEIVDFMRTRQAQNTGFLKELEEFGVADSLPKMEGRRMIVMVSPKKLAPKKKEA